MDNLNSRPILVTGAHRTGTTWVGKMLAANKM
ncbi:MAG: sulfotransferase [Chloroflexi bacterium]|nr:sulfotransferase [Chloroflexota bacterium]